MEISQIEYFDNLLEELAVYFSKQQLIQLNRNNIFDALFLVLSDNKDIEWDGDLWDLQLTKTEAKETLKDFDFTCLFAHIETDDSSFKEVFLYQKKVLIKNNGLKWIIHKNDSDPFPSIPHAHNIDQNIKLDLSNGNCYRRRKYLKKISKKELLEIREKAKKVYTGNLPVIKV